MERQQLKLVGASLFLNDKDLPAAICATATKLKIKGKLGEIGAASLAKVLKVNTTLESLDLGHNSVGVEGTASLAEALEVNSTLKSLYVGHNCVSDKGVALLAEALKVNTTLQSLYLWRNFVGVEGAAVRAEAAGRNLLVPVKRRHARPAFGRDAVPSELLLHPTEALVARVEVDQEDGKRVSGHLTTPEQHCSVMRLCCWWESGWYARAALAKLLE